MLYFLETAGLPDLIANLFPNLPNFIAHLVATIILIVVLSLLVYKPFKRNMKLKKDKINEVIYDAIKDKTEARQKLKEADNIVKEAKHESELIRKSSFKDAKIIKKELIKSANIEIENLKNNTASSLEQEKYKIEAELKNKSIDMAFSAAEAILKNEISKEKNQKLIESFLDELDED